MDNEGESQPTLPFCLDLPYDHARVTKDPDPNGGSTPWHADDEDIAEEAGAGNANGPH
ncbi:hypothetical protein GCM10023405_01910 [Streptomonospora salina]